MVKQQDDPSVRRLAFISAYVETRSVVSAALKAGVPQWMAASVGVQLITTLSIQREIILSMPAGEDRLEMAKSWQLDPETGDIVEPVTLMSRIAAKREELAAKAREPQPSQILITRPVYKRPSRAKARITQGAAA
jgi:hypothetical protein